MATVVPSHGTLLPSCYAYTPIWKAYMAKKSREKRWERRQVILRYTHTCNGIFPTRGNLTETKLHMRF